MNPTLLLQRFLKDIVKAMYWICLQPVKKLFSARELNRGVESVWQSVFKGFKGSCFAFSLWHVFWKELMAL
jgi:hypothetical protein